MSHSFATDTEIWHPTWSPSWLGTLHFRVRHHHSAVFLLNDMKGRKKVGVYTLLNFLPSNVKSNEVSLLAGDKLQFVRLSGSITKPSSTTVSSPVCTTPFLFSKESFNCSFTLSTGGKNPNLKSFATYENVEIKTAGEEWLTRPLMRHGEAAPVFVRGPRRAPKTASRLQGPRPTRAASTTFGCSFAWQRSHRTVNTTRRPGRRLPRVARKTLVRETMLLRSQTVCSLIPALLLPA